MGLGQSLIGLNHRDSNSVRRLVILYHHPGICWSGEVWQALIFHAVVSLRAMPRFCSPSLLTTRSCFRHFWSFLSFREIQTFLYNLTIVITTSHLEPSQLSFRQTLTYFSNSLLGNRGTSLQSQISQSSSSYSWYWIETWRFEKGESDLSSIVFRS